jgi:hypothetical protein
MQNPMSSHDATHTGQGKDGQDFAHAHAGMSRRVRIFFWIAFSTRQQMTKDS